MTIKKIIINTGPFPWGEVLASVGRRGAIFLAINVPGFYLYFYFGLDK